MNKKQQAFTAIFSLSIGIISGIAGTAFAIGSSHQKIKGDLITANMQISSLKASQEEFKDRTEREMERRTIIVTSHITALQDCISDLVDKVSELKADVQVVKAILERAERSSMSG